MARKYHRVVGPSRRQQYSQENLEKAVKSVIAKQITLRKASEKYGVPRNTISAHVIARRNCKEVKALGGQTVFSPKIEEVLCKCILLCAEWGFPLRGSDIMDTVASVLSNKGINEKRFTNNRPGRDWLTAFLRRNKELTVRLGQNIKRARAEVTVNTINEYFNHLENTLQDIPPCNIVNFDETNFTDDPGNTKVVVRRGCRRPENVMDCSKQSTSVMICAAADGILLPPFVVYKAQYVYPTWIEGGIEGTQYASNKSGWFDMALFESWFFKICLPYLKGKLGRKAMIGDNLASHLSVKVIEQCADNDISFVLLPPNATHICQPLDVSFFAPMKRAWRKTLSEWKKNNRGCIPKSEFPHLLKTAVESLVNLTDTIKSGFKACGISPINRECVLKHFPQQEENVDEESPNWSKAIVEKLQVARYPEPVTGKKRGKKIDVPAGQSISLEDFNNNKSLVMNEENTDEEQEDDVDECVDYSLKKNSGVLNEKETSVINPPELKEDDFLLVKFTTEEDNRKKLYIGQLKNILEGKKYEIKFMRKKEGRKQVWFSFPEVPDIETVDIDDVICKVHLRVERRGHFFMASLPPCVQMKDLY